MSQVDTTSVRAQLQSEKQDIEEHLERLTADGAASPDFDENFADSAQVSAEQSENLALAASFRDQLDEVIATLERIDAGTYGVCEVCDKAIAPARLEAVPTARTCIDHA